MNWANAPGRKPSTASSRRSSTHSTRRHCQSPGPGAISGRATRTFDTIPLIKVVVPAFIKKELPPPTARDLIDDETLERLGTVDPEDIARIVSDPRLMRTMDEARVVRRGLERKRLDLAADPAALMAQAAAIADSKLTEDDERILSNSKIKARGHKQLSAIAYLMKNKRLVLLRKEPTRSGGVMDATARGTERLAELRRNRRARGILSRDTPMPTLEAIEKRRRRRLDVEAVVHLGSQIMAGRSGGDGTRQYRTVDLNVVKTPASAKQKLRKVTTTARKVMRHGSTMSSCRYTPDKYTVGGFEQLCAAADNLCEAYVEGHGEDELARYRQRFQGNSDRGLFEQSKNGARVRIRETAQQVEELQTRVARLNGVIEGRYRELSKWLELQH